PSRPHVSFLLLTPRPPPSTLFPYTTLFRSRRRLPGGQLGKEPREIPAHLLPPDDALDDLRHRTSGPQRVHPRTEREDLLAFVSPDRKSTRLNSSHRTISYAVFCLKKKTKSS